MNDVTEIKNCPFCGGISYFRRTNYGHSNSYFTVGAEVGCKECGITMRSENKFDVDANLDIAILQGNDEINQMIKKWNTRMS